MKWNNMEVIVDMDEHLKMQAELARLRKIEQAAKTYMNNTPESEIELAREVWGNTNTRIVLDTRRALAAALDEK